MEAAAGMRGEIMVDRARMGEAEVKAESKGNFWWIGCGKRTKEDPVMTVIVSLANWKDEVAISWDKEGLGE